MTTAIRELIAGLPGINIDEWMQGRSFPLVEGKHATIVWRGEGKSLCPSEVARALGGEQWRELMPAVRAVAFELQAAGEVRVTQKSRVVDATARGAIRVQIVK